MSRSSKATNASPCPNPCRRRPRQRPPPILLRRQRQRPKRRRLPRPRRPRPTPLPRHRRSNPPNAMKAIAIVAACASYAFSVAATVRSQDGASEGWASASNSFKSPYGRWEASTRNVQLPARDLTVAATRNNSSALPFVVAATAQPAVGAPSSRSARTAAEPAVKLTGIAHMGEGEVVLLEIRHPGGGVIRPILQVGDQTDGIEVVSIDPKAGTASLRQGGKVTEFSIGAGGDPAKTPTVNCKDADSRQVLELYQKLSVHTVIAAPSLPAARVTVKSDADPAGAVARALGDQGIAVTPRFDKFAFATTLSDARLLEEFKAPPAPPSDPKAERFPAGLIMFRDADRSQVLDIYQELVGRTLITSPHLPSAKISIRSETALTRGEAVWLIESALQLGGIAATIRFDKFAFATALADAPSVARIKPPPAPPTDPNVERFPSGLIKILNADVNQVLDIYQELAGRTVLKGAGLPAAFITLRSQTELTRDEAAWLLESALQLAGIAATAPFDKFAFVTAPADAPRLA